ncbi:hypothetical protein TRFO_24703 [Tritrichomonas foetus]|uniref:Uncharacterized protein n=1 Tax=Tritrichomonas foetus TaxID=1144522 RepID=A0A1J4K6S0_9EUKA|nr:hypothetical protein TRFO_24703 [Tritrichomonas foetus]|eukprot:OHT07055.1 hypothetical protein TRFO_24703 [Tritrichomonas foetus]
MILCLKTKSNFRLDSLHSYISRFSKDQCKSYIYNLVKFDVPSNIVDPILYKNHKKTRKFINNWIAKVINGNKTALSINPYDFEMSSDQYVLVKPEIHDVIYTFLTQFRGRKPGIWYSALDLPQIRFNEFQNEIEILNKNLEVSQMWQISKQFLIVPKNKIDEARKVIEQYMVNDSNESTVHSCIYMCSNPNNPKTKKYHVPVFKTSTKDGEYKPLCIECLIESLINSTSKIYNPEKRKFNKKVIFENKEILGIIPICSSNNSIEKDGEIIWPKVPFGVFLFTLLHNSSSDSKKLSALVDS